MGNKTPVSVPVEEKKVEQKPDVVLNQDQKDDSPLEENRSLSQKVQKRVSLLFFFSISATKNKQISKFST